MPEPVIKAEGLRKRYDGFEAVRGIDLEVARGEVFAFLGPNGAGKTTTVEILEGYRERSAGEVSVLGVDPARADRSWRERIGIVLQQGRSTPELTARETVELYAGYYARPLDLDVVIGMTGLGSGADKRVAHLSSGQQRRLDVALALVGDPDLVFLDEPTTGFDPEARRQSWQVIAGLGELGKTVFLTTHYMDEAQALADRVAIIRAGELVAEGSPDELGAARGQAEISFRLPAGMTSADLPDMLSELSVEGGLVRARPDDGVAALHALTGWALERGVALEALEVRRPNLEDAYLDLVGEQQGAAG